MIGIAKNTFFSVSLTSVSSLSRKEEIIWGRPQCQQLPTPTLRIGLPPLHRLIYYGRDRGLEHQAEIVRVGNGEDGWGRPVTVQWRRCCHRRSGFVGEMGAAAATTDVTLTGFNDS